MWKQALHCVIALSLLFTATAQKAEDYKVTDLPGLDPDDNTLSQYAGHIAVSPETNGHLFFWMIEQVEKTTPEKLIIWLNGGPGCSSMDGLFLENGPFRIQQNLSLAINPAGWQQYATMVYVDQPVGTGFSFADTNSYMHNMTQISEEFTTFLDKFLDVFPHLREQEMYLAGESFAGTYIPYFASRMVELNKKNEIKYNLKGLAIGNGWISPVHQYDAYYDFGVAKGLLTTGYANLAASHLKACHEVLETQVTINVEVCESIIQDIMDSSVHEKKEEPFPDCGRNWPYELIDVTRYLRQPLLKPTIHTEKQSVGWLECSTGVGRALADDQSEPSYDLLPLLLEEMRILLFSGEADLICNHFGTEYLIGNMTWAGKTGFAGAKPKDWFIGQEFVGQYTEARNLSYVLIKDGSHMVPYDQPLPTLDMINRFLGVGDNQVNGQPSRVGDKTAATKPSGKPSTKPSKKPAPTNNTTEASEAQTSDPTNVTETPEPATAKEDWSKYYNWGTSALIVVILFGAIAGFCWYRSRKNARQGYMSDLSTQPKGPLSRLFAMFGKFGSSDHRKLRLQDPEESNELDELVVETPTLFNAEDYSYSDDEHEAPRPRTEPSTKPQTTTRFAIADDDDDDDDDFDDDDFDDDWGMDPIDDKKKGAKAE
ncbi:Alpha/Beta hydrolase protein [Radiomyces spectabilis]|uniref:Alpha/Beta hydrolase protein n=1 Tax=Radiomyces spectabilis TaxID=64574 RepID=UPI00221F3968|nr:Alpha/Beta hydrolase protein [Radiomyces spectabilis]KAI8366746.1 Alpha/Beta hydrolase protein [Radiomyces spectabilis]